MAKIIIDPFTGVKHLPGSGLCSTVTACGTADNFTDEKDHIEEGMDCEGLPDCAGCIDIAKEIYKAISKKELKNFK